MTYDSVSNLIEIPCDSVFNLLRLRSERRIFENSAWLRV